MLRVPLTKALLVSIALVLLWLSSAVRADARMRIGILSFESKTETASRWQPTANFLQSTLPSLLFEIVPLGYDELNAAVESATVDFVLTNPEHYVVLRNVFRLSPMLTLNTLIGNGASSTFGGVIFTRTDATDIQQLQDVRGKRVAAVGLYSLGGFLAAADIFRQQHIDLRSSDVRSLRFVGTPHSKVVSEVLSGEADVGMVRTGVLEKMAQQGKLDLKQVRVLNAQAATAYPQLLSTELFAEWPFAAMPKVAPEVVKAVALALLNISPDSSIAHAGNYYGFTPPANYAPVEELMRRLKVYPNVESMPLWKELWLSYSEEIEFSLFLLFLVGAGATMYLWIGNRKLRNLSQLYQEAQAGLKVTAAAFESQVGIIVTDETTRIVRANAAFTKLFGYAEPQLLGHPTNMLRSDIIPEGTLREIWPILQAKGRWQGELSCRHQSGKVVPCVVAVTALSQNGQAPTGFVGSFLDISIQKQAENEARQLAFYDPLTELPNRRLFIDRLQTEITLAVRHHQLGALMFIDLDDFKVLNDSYGHTVGDQLLRLIAQRLNLLTGDAALAARLGGDEFVVMLPNLGAVASVAQDRATTYAWQIRRAILDPYELSTQPTNHRSGQYLHYNISGSIGVALFGDQEEPVIEVLKRADVAMYQSKQGGKDTIRLYDPHVQSALVERVALSTELNAALAQDQLLLHYQMQTTADGIPVGAECLLRWQHPVRGMVPPVEFIALAEDSGAIIGMGDWVLRQACTTLARWEKLPALEQLTLSVNVSPRQFTDADFVLRVEKALQETGASPHRLCLEITEGVVLHDADQVIEKMRRLCAIGLSFSIDDFGTGYSSLSYLQRLPLRELKIDKSFVHDLATNTTSEAIARAIVALGLGMKIDVLAEGVETEAQRSRLTALGCERMQGYLFARPMALLAMEARIAAGPVLQKQAA
jgi:diguanylate cyclase (GGDEF)-like protein/PAS domain S-box-containing protein